jgi:hypothetical protein
VAGKNQVNSKYWFFSKSVGEEVPGVQGSMVQRFIGSTVQRFIGSGFTVSVSLLVTRDSVPFIRADPFFLRDVFPCTWITRTGRVMTFQFCCEA